MKTLSAFSNVAYSHPYFPSSIFPSEFLSPSRENREVLCFRFRGNIKCARVLNLRSFRAFSSPSSTTGYGGWDDFGNYGDTDEFGYFRSVLVSLGINDNKYVFTFLLGLVTAFSISRVRVSSLAVFPVSILVFAVGFSLGFIRSDGFNKRWSKKRSKDEIGWFHQDKLRKLVDFLDTLDAKVGHLKKNVQKAFHSRKITDSDLEGYISAIDSLRLLVLDTRKIVDVFAEDGGQHDALSTGNQDLLRKKESRDVVFEPPRFVEGLFGGKSVDWKYDKESNIVKEEATRSWADDRAQGAMSSSMEGKTSDKTTANSSLFEDSASKYAFGQDVNMKTEVEKRSSNPMAPGSGITDMKEYDHWAVSKNCLDDDRVSLNMHERDETVSHGGDKNLLDSVDISMGAEASLVKDRILKKSRGVYWASSLKENFEEETLESYRRKEKWSYEVDSRWVEYLNSVDASMSPFSASSNDALFNSYLTEANALVREAKELIITRHHEERAEIILQKSAGILSEAIALRPMSLLAVGQLGNTYLLHGELKLSISRKLRASLSNLKLLQKQVLNDSFPKEKIVSHLVSTCEDCEELLVKAGRSYKLALSIDGNDVKALYNWGLALSFRGQLIADIGPEAASEADKVFMAAIDKFDAMISKGNVYAPEALLRWGMVLQQRSRLRPSDSREKLKLLQQAKSLYEGALGMDAGNLQVRDALSSCKSELSHKHL